MRRECFHTALGHDLHRWRGYKHLCWRRRGSAGYLEQQRPLFLDRQSGFWVSDRLFWCLNRDRRGENSRNFYLWRRRSLPIQEKKERGNKNQTIDQHLFFSNHGTIQPKNDDANDGYRKKKPPSEESSERGFGKNVLLLSYHPGNLGLENCRKSLRGKGNGNGEVIRRNAIVAV